MRSSVVFEMLTPSAAVIKATIIAAAIARVRMYFVPLFICCRVGGQSPC
jgi:hypothetical protein